MKHYQSGIEWKTGANNQLQHRGSKWYLLTHRGGESSEVRVSKKVAKSLLEGGMGHCS